MKLISGKRGIHGFAVPDDRNLLTAADWRQMIIQEQGFYLDIVGLYSIRIPYYDFS